MKRSYNFSHPCLKLCPLGEVYHWAPVDKHAQKNTKLEIYSKNNMSNIIKQIMYTNVCVCVF